MSPHKYISFDKNEKDLVRQRELWRQNICSITYSFGVSDAGNNHLFYLNVIDNGENLNV